MNIFISYSHNDTEFTEKLTSALETAGYTVFYDQKILGGSDIYKYIGKSLAHADVVILILSSNTNNSKYIYNEINTAISLFNLGKLPLIIPIILGNDVAIPFDLNQLKCFIVQNNDLLQYSAAINNVKLTLAAFDEKLKNAKHEKEQSEEKVKTGLTEYIDTVFQTLKKNEKRNRQQAFGLYAFSAIALIAVLLVIIFLPARIDIMITPIERLAAYGVMYLILSIILISFSKLFFTLAKAFMVESIRCSDRIHAISFGKFFIDAYGEKATIEQILKAFSAWNYDNGGSSFRTQSGEDYDPKLIEIISKLKGL
jgi:hypothetical protein